MDPGRPNQPPPKYRPIKGDIYIQVGAYGDPANAQRSRDLMEIKLNQPVRIDRSDPGQEAGKVLYRVQVGPYRDVEETDVQAAIIAEMGIETYIIID
jgi:cell division protein FtsN